jgi:hypothetical protein
MSLIAERSLDYADGRAEAPRDRCSAVFASITNDNHIELVGQRTSRQRLQRSGDHQTLIVSRDYNRNHIERISPWANDFESGICHYHCKWPMSRRCLFNVVVLRRAVLCIK